MSTANPSTGSGSLSDRINVLTQKLSQQEASISRSTTVTMVVGVIALALLTAYFYFGYGEIAKLLEPKTLVPYGAGMLEDNLPDARQRMVQLVNDSAPAWAEQVSQNLRQSIPTAREKLEDYILSQTDDMLVQTTKITEEKFRATIQENRELVERASMNWPTAKTSRMSHWTHSSLRSTNSCSPTCVTRPRQFSTPCNTCVTAFRNWSSARNSMRKSKASGAS